jgi:hypothetical protein
MLWNGQEFGENWGLPSSGLVRNLFERPLHWEYFYDGYGKALIRLYRILGSLRRESSSLGAFGYFYYFFESDHLARKCIAYNRRDQDGAGNVKESVIIALNFSAQAQDISIRFHAVGSWTEVLDGSATLQVSHADEAMTIRVPSYYGLIYKWVAH